MPPIYASHFIRYGFVIVAREGTYVRNLENELRRGIKEKDSRWRGTESDDVRTSGVQ